MGLGILKLKLVAEIWEYIKNFRIARTVILSFSKVANAAMTSMSTTMGKLGLVSAAVFASIAAGFILFRKQLEPAIELQQNVASIATLMRDRVGEAFSTVNKWALTFTQNIINMSAEFGEAANSTAKGLYDILSATIPAADAVNVLTVSMRAARAGLTTTAVATKAIISVLMSYSMSFDQAAKVSDIFFATIRRGVTTFRELAPVVGRAAATAAAAGVSFEELMASITTMTRAGLDTGVAVTSINQTLLQFFKPTDDAIKVAARLGLTLDLTTLKTEGLISVMEKMSEILPEQVGQIFRQMRALRGVNALVQQVTGFTEDYNVMLNAAGETQKAFEKQSNALRFSLDRMKENFNALRTQAMLPWLPTLRKMSEGINSFMGVLRKISPTVSKFAADIIFLTGTIAALTAAIALTTSALAALGIALLPLLILIGKLAVIGAAIYAVITLMIDTEKKFHIAEKAIKAFFNTLETMGGPGLEDFKNAINAVGKAFKWLGEQIGLVDENWSEFQAAKNLSSSLKRLTEEIDANIKPTDELRERWVSVMEALKRGAPITGEVKEALDDLAGTLKITPVYTDETREGLLELIEVVNATGVVTPRLRETMAGLADELRNGKKRGSEYVEQWVAVLEILEKEDTLSNAAREALAGLSLGIRENNGLTGDMKDRLEGLVHELLSTATMSDLIRQKMKELQDAFNAARAATARLTAAFDLLGLDMPEQLADIAKQADWAFNTIFKEGTYTAEQLSEIWIDGFVPKLIDAFGKIPEKYRETTLQLTGYTLEMVESLAKLDVDLPTTMQKEARAAAKALLTVVQQNNRLPEASRVSAEVIIDTWDDVIKKIETAFSTVPVEFEALSQAITQTSTTTLNSLRELGEEPITLMRKRADAMLEAFLDIEKQTGTLVDPAQLREMFGTVQKAFENAYGSMPIYVQTVFDRIIGSWEALQKEEKEILEDRKAQIASGLTISEWETYKRLKPLIKGWERAFRDIRNMEDISAEDRSAGFKKLIVEIEAAGGKYTDVWRRVYNALNLLNKSQIRSFEEIAKDVAVEIRREMSNALEESIMNWSGQSQKAMALVKAEFDEKKRALRDQMIEGKITQERMYQELDELDRQYTDEKMNRMKGFEKFYTSIWDSMKKYWVKLLAEMLAEFITNQLKMMAVQLKNAIFGITVDTAAAETKAVKSAAGIPFPLNIAAIAASVAAVGMALSKVSKFADGGIVTKPMLGMVGEAGSSEAIIPLNRAGKKLAGLFGADRGNTMIFNDKFVFEGPTMVDSQETWDSVYREKVLPAKRRYNEELRDISGEDIT